MTDRTTQTLSVDSVDQEIAAAANGDQRRGKHSGRRINRLIRELGASNYLEIGVAGGATFRSIDVASKTAVDPSFRFDKSAMQSERCIYHEVTSDDFFRRHAGDERYDVIFLDGLHTFEQTFRDFCSSMAHAHRRTVWLIDDTVPNDVFSAWPNQRQAIRLRRAAGLPGRQWHGDVYKVVFAIHDYFPNLSFATTAAGTDNPQTVVWYEPRPDFKPHFPSLEAITRLTWFDLQQHLGALNTLPENEALECAVNAVRGSAVATITESSAA